MSYIGKVCKQGFALQVLKSNAGYYLGTVDKDGTPKCRISSVYADTEEVARKLGIDGQTRAENFFCNQTGNCFK